MHYFLLTLLLGGFTRKIRFPDQRQSEPNYLGFAISICIELNLILFL